ncbi:unnamed protein product, partial [Prunus brigantina]
AQKKNEKEEGAAGSCGKVLAAVSDVTKKGGVGGSTAGSCGEVPTAMSDVPGI